MNMHVEQARKDRLAGSVDASASAGSARNSRDQRSRSGRRKPPPSDLPNDGMLGVEQSHVLDGHGWPRVLGQIFRQARVAFVAHFDVDGIELIVCLLPAFAEQGEPCSGDCEKVLVVVEPDRLRLEGESVIAKSVTCIFWPWSSSGEVGQTLQPGFAGGKQVDRCSMCFLQGSRPGKPSRRGAVIADVESAGAGAWPSSAVLFQRATPSLTSKCSSTGAFR